MYCKLQPFISIALWNNLEFASCDLSCFSLYSIRERTPVTPSTATPALQNVIAIFVKTYGYLCRMFVLFTPLHWTCHVEHMKYIYMYSPNHNGCWGWDGWLSCMSNLSFLSPWVNCAWKCMLLYLSHFKHLHVTTHYSEDTLHIHVCMNLVLRVWTKQKRVIVFHLQLLHCNVKYLWWHPV